MLTSVNNVMAQAITAFYGILFPTVAYITAQHPAILVVVLLMVIIAAGFWGPQSLVLTMPLFLAGHYAVHTGHAHLSNLVWQGELGLFIVVFFLRYARTVVNWLVWINSKPYPLPAQPTYLPSDVTVICPTVHPDGQEFIDCMESVLATGPARIIVSVPNKAAKTLGVEVCGRISHDRIKVIRAHQANKRSQICAALPRVKTAITVFIDDHVFWPAQFLTHTLAPFEDPFVGAVGTEKKVTREHRADRLSNFGSIMRDFTNFLGCIYIERLNFECVSMSRIDGGVPLLPGPTVAIRTEIVRKKHFMEEFEFEHAFFGLVGPLNADDDNFVTRYTINNNWKIRVQTGPEATMEISLGVYPKYKAQLVRWARTVWRSTFASLVNDRKCYTANPWTTYSIHFASLANFSLFTDLYLLCLLWLLTRDYSCHTLAMLSLSAWILFFKMVKVWRYFSANLADFALYLVPYIVFGWFHSLIKFWAMLTSWVASWGSRPGVK